MWVEERNRRAYKISEENWSIVHRNIKDKYKDKDKPREYKDISIISEVNKLVLYIPSCWCWDLSLDHYDKRREGGGESSSKTPGRVRKQRVYWRTIKSKYNAWYVSLIYTYLSNFNIACNTFFV